MITEEVQQGRVELWQKNTAIDPNKLVFIDESGFWIGMSRAVARALEGQRVIEMMWSQIKSMVRLFRTRTVEALTGVIEVAISLVDAQFFKNWFTKCCYCTE